MEIRPITLDRITLGRCVLHNVCPRNAHNYRPRVNCNSVAFRTLTRNYQLPIHAHCDIKQIRVSHVRLTYYCCSAITLLRAVFAMMKFVVCI